LDLRELHRRRCIRADNEDKIPPHSKAIKYYSNRLAYAAPSAIAIHSFAYTLPNHKPTARPASPAGGGVER
jgi:hypothetical protein